MAYVVYRELFHIHSHDPSTLFFFRSTSQVPCGQVVEVSFRSMTCVFIWTHSNCFFHIILAFNSSIISDFVGILAQSVPVFVIVMGLDILHDDVSFHFSLYVP